MCQALPGSSWLAVLHRLHAVRKGENQGLFPEEGDMVLGVTALSLDHQSWFSMNVYVPSSLLCCIIHEFGPSQHSSWCSHLRSPLSYSFTHPTRVHWIPTRGHTLHGSSLSVPPLILTFFVAPSIPWLSETSCLILAQSISLIDVQVWPVLGLFHVGRMRKNLGKCDSLYK